MVSESTNNSRVGRTDLFMILTVFLWAVNFSVIKVALREFPPHAFNGLRLSLASVVYLVLLGFRREGFFPPKGDRWKTAVLGLLGISFYQVFFIRAISMTSASMTSIIMATTPVFIALISSAVGQEKISWAGWLGIGISFAGFLLVVSTPEGGFVLSWRAVEGTVLILLSNISWAAYTVMSKPVLDRTSPFKLAALGTSMGTLVYLPYAFSDLGKVRWDQISGRGWAAVLYSGVVAIVLCFSLWYYSVKKVGSSKTGIYGNLTPVFATAFAAVTIGERITKFQAAGALLVFAGVYLTRSGYRLFVRRTGSQTR